MIFSKDEDSLNMFSKDMDFPVKNTTDCVNLLKKYVFRKFWNTNSYKLDYSHNICHEYKKIKWDNIETVDWETFKRIFPIKTALPSWLTLIRKKTIRNHKHIFSKQDTIEELLRREIVCQMDDRHWNCSERYYERRKKKTRKKSLTKPSKKVSITIKGLCSIKDIGTFKITNIFKKKLAFIIEELKKRPYIFDKEHPLWVREEQLRGFFTNYYFNRRKKYESFDKWIEEHCWAKVKARKIAGWKSQSEKMKEICKKKKWSRNK